MKRLLFLGLAACLWAASAQADWNIGDPAKWAQLPQMVNGYDVLSIDGVYPTSLPVNKAVADDWMCMDPSPVTDIHVWGSWWMDQPPDPGSWIPTFKLTIYADIPAGPGTYSQPGKELWSVVQQPTVRFWGLGTEWFYDPNNILPISPETQVWQYNFVLSEADYFAQEQGTIYWLSVQALNPPIGHVWGWKTSDMHWNDDATWRDYQMEWNELRDPQEPTQSLDMAFVITIPEPGTAALMGVVAVLGLARRLRLRR